MTTTTTIKSPGRSKISAIQLLMLLVTFALVSGCAKQQPARFYPSEPAPPRIQHLITFNTMAQLKGNDIIKMIAGNYQEGYFDRTFGLTFHDNKIFIVDIGKNAGGYAIFDLITKKSNFIKGVLQKPTYIEVDTDGTRYVSDTNLEKVIVLDSSDTPVRSIKPKKGSFRPIGLEIIADKLYVSDVDNNKIFVFNKITGEELFSFGEKESLWWPHEITITPEGNVLVTESGKAIVSSYTQNGEFIRSYGSRGDKMGNFVRPKSSAVDREGLIYTVDAAFGNVQVYDKDYRMYLAFGSTYPEDMLVLPAGITIDYDHIQHFQKYAAPEFNIEYLVAVTSQGGPNTGSSVVVYGVGRMAGKDYSAYDK